MEDISLTKKAEKCKNQGNDEFKKGNYDMAIDHYTNAIGKCFDNFRRLIMFIFIECYGQEPAYFTNRAIAYLKTEKYERAKQDCQRALDIDPKFAKAYNRLSKCCIALGDLYNASLQLQKSIELDPANAVNKKD
jgi:tetratricopeptide (TPR) repeat protein